MDKLINIIGLIGSIGISLSLFPQTIKTIKSNDIQSLSSSFIIVTLIASCLQLIYGYYYFVIPMIIANICVFVNTFVILIYINLHRNN